MKTKTKAHPKNQVTTNFVMITPELQVNNEQVLKAYTKIVEVAVELLKGFEMKKYRTYIMMDHLKNELNANLISEFVCHFYNITLSNSKDGRSFIFIEIDEEYVSKFGNNLPNRLLREAYKLTQSEDNTAGIEYCLRPQFAPSDVHNFFFRNLVNGETEVISILVAERAEVN
ncbi:MAG: hypothetical protein V4546_08990 [Bacteroidota bacterium]